MATIKQLFKEILNYTNSESIKSLFYKTNELVDAVNSLQTSTTPSYKILRVNITQSGSSDATINILENTFNGTPTITSNTMFGNYDIILTGEFSTADKSNILIKPSEFTDTGSGLGATNKMYEHSIQIIIYN
jgi:hypothetical protein